MPFLTTIEPTISEVGIYYYVARRYTPLIRSVNNFYSPGTGDIFSLTRFSEKSVRNQIKNPFINIDRVRNETSRPIQCVFFFQASTEFSAILRICFLRNTKGKASTNLGSA
jgi:hypothetical protein